MINEKIVFILGAGASEAYGYPLGPKLVKKIGNALAEKNDKTREIAKALSAEHSNKQDLDWMEEEVVKFRNRLIGSKKSTIDSFLGVKGNESFIDIGKLAIAQALIPCEKRGKLDSFNDNNWYRELYKLMDATFEKFDQNECSFITFNYDRSLDCFLFDAVRNTYGNTNEQECVEKIARLLPVHLYGQLNVFPWQNINEGRGYEPKCTSFQFKTIAKNIKIVHDNSGAPNSPEFQTAYSLIADAEKIIFMGFGYDETNLKRLDIKLMKGKTIIGTKYNLDRRIFISAQNYFRDVLGNDIIWKDQTAENFIREEYKRNSSVILNF
jgi:hypothetical protein